MNQTKTLFHEDLHTQLHNKTKDSLCNTSLCEEIKPVEDGETYLERSLGFLIIGIIGVLANAFVILFLGSSAKITQNW